VNKFMKKLNKRRFIPFLVTLSLLFMMAVPTMSVATPAPVSLGTAANFAVLAGSTVTNTGSSVVTGDLGLYPGTSVTGFPPGILHGVPYISDGAGVASKAETDLQTAYNEATAAASTAVYGKAVDIGGETFGPGVYDFPSSVEITGPVTLNGSASDVFIFRIGTTLTTASSSSVILGGSVDPDNVFWQVGSSATLGTSSIFKGNILAEDSITGTTSATVIGGRLLAITGAVTLDTNTITNPVPPPTPNLDVIKVVSGGTAAPGVFSIHVKTAGTSGSDVVGSPEPGVASPGTSYTLPTGTYVVSEDASGAPTGYTPSYSSGGTVTGSGASMIDTISLVSGTLTTVTITNTYAAAPTTAILHVIKVVSGGTTPASGFSLYVKTPGTSGSDVGGPAPGVVTPGTSYTLPYGTYVVSESPVAGYTASYSGASDSSGNVTLSAVDNNEIVTITNTYTNPSGVVIPPLINVVKTPSPLALTTAGGPVTYTYTVTNPGTVPLSNVSVTDNKVSPVTYVSGDTNSNSLLDPSETWIYTGKANLTATTTDTATATGSANGLTATDVAYATVVLSPTGTVVPPLINVIKTPDPLALPAGGGTVTYTYTVTNPGVIPLSNVSVTDNKVSPVTYVSGDTNSNSLLDPGETWFYTGKANLTATTADTATATGSANGLPATHIAYATVVVGNSRGGGGGGGGGGSSGPVVVTPTVTSPVVVTPTVASPVVTPSVVVTPTVASPVVTSPVVVTRTVTGGQIPKTSTPFSIPMYELLLIGAVLTLFGAVGWRKRKRYE
jgi:uncharacterized repeat protein (TIGR01451 family)